MVRRPGGQALVECALVLPLLVLTAVVIVQILAAAHNHVQLQRLAQARSRRVFEGTASASAPVWPHGLWGRVSLPRIDRREAPLHRGRPFQGISTVQHSGRTISLTFSTRQVPRTGWQGLLQAASYEALAEVPVEPPVPEER